MLLLLALILGLALVLWLIATSLCRSVTIPSTEKLDVVNGDLSGVFLHPLGVCVRSGPQASLDEDLGAFPYEFFSDVSGLSPGNDVVPFSVLPLFSVAVPVSFGRGKSECGHFGSLACLAVSVEVTYFRISSNVTDQHYFVE